MYAKLENNEIIYAVSPLSIDGRDIFTNDFTEYGYKPVEIPEPPAEEGYYAVADGFEETETAIIQKWRLEPIPAEQIIEELKQQLAASDYKAIKYAEGWISEEDYAPIKVERQAIRDRINELEGH